jgi:hypothetical protein
LNLSPINAELGFEPGISTGSRFKEPGFKHGENPAAENAWKRIPVEPATLKTLDVELDSNPCLNPVPENEAHVFLYCMVDQ